jgi:hypothetical protein
LLRGTTDAPVEVNGNTLTLFIDVLNSGPCPVQ